jgi:hypothetical protein
VRRALVPLLLALLLVPALADEKELAHHFLGDSTQVGDWCTLEAKVAVDGGDVAGLPSRVIVTYRVTEATADAFEVKTESTPPHDDEWKTKHFRRGSKSLTELLQLGPDVKVTDLQQSDDQTLTVGDRQFKCQKLSFLTTQGELQQQNELWLSADMKSLRIVALSTRVTSDRKLRVRLDMEVRGFGDKDHVLWGKRAEDLLKD